jgi:branched-chain amino acid aminotransferase
MNAIMHRFAVHNDAIHEVSDRVLSPGQVGLLSGWGVFSTLRVQDGVLFAWERHWARMQRDAALMHVPFPTDADAVHDRLLRLVEANGAQSATMRVIVVRNGGGKWEGPGISRGHDLIAFTADTTEWGTGVKLGVVPQARHSSYVFAGAKSLSWSMNLAWLEDAHARGFDEVVLLNERGEVSECTSANIFIAEGCKVWTPPLRSGCLPGVTRELLLSEVRTPGIEVGERVLHLSDLANADEVFITSTTRDLLPVTSVEGITVRCGDTTRRALSRAFSAYMDAYVSERKSPLPTSR